MCVGEMRLLVGRREENMHLDPSRFRAAAAMGAVAPADKHDL